MSGERDKEFDGEMKKRVVSWWAANTAAMGLDGADKLSNKKNIKVCACRAQIILQLMLLLGVHDGKYSLFSRRGFRRVRRSIFARLLRPPTCDIIIIITFSRIFFIFFFLICITKERRILFGVKKKKIPKKSIRTERY